jgi:hypothetical protein
MFAFWQGSLHVSKDVFYVEDNIILSYFCQVLDVNLGRMFWIVTNGRYLIIGKNVLNNSQDNILTPSTITSMANIVV